MKPNIECPNCQKLMQGEVQGAEYGDVFCDGDELHYNCEHCKTDLTLVASVKISFDAYIDKLDEVQSD